MKNFKRDAQGFIQKTWLQDDITELFEQVSDDFMFESPITNARGFEWFAKYIDSVKTGFSNMNLSFRNVYSDENSAVAYYTLSADHSGVFMGLKPTGKTVKFDVFTYIEFADEEIRYVRSVFDLFELKNQLDIFNKKSG
ncbi:MAG: ester cyclase [Rhodothermaceae bacterium]